MATEKTVIGFNLAPTRAEIEEALVNLCDRAKRCFPVVGLPGPATDWDRAHHQINQHLDQRDEAL